MASSEDVSIKIKLEWMNDKKKPKIQKNLRRMKKKKQRKGGAAALPQGDRHEGKHSKTEGTLNARTRRAPRAPFRSERQGTRRSHVHCKNVQTRKDVEVGLTGKQRGVDKTRQRVFGLGRQRGLWNDAWVVTARALLYCKDHDGTDVSHILG